MRGLAAALMAAALAAGGAAFALQAPSAGGFLGEAGPDTLSILPPPPAAGSARDLADRALFRETRGLKDSPRWAMAARDVDEGDILADQACALGATLSPGNAPRTAALLARARRDVRRAVNRPKDHYRRPRPYLVESGPTCVLQLPGLAASPDYPSGHATWGWTVGLILAELAPDRATPILVRARAFGESRLVCGVHSLSAVEAGRTNAAILVAALHGSPEFRHDLDAAREEVAAARKAGPAPDPAACAAERALTASAY